MKKLFLSFFILFHSISSAQVDERVVIRGNIKVPEGSEPEGITIYNKNTSQGTVSSKKGYFEIAAKAGDTLYFSAVQYRGLSIVLDEDTIEKGVLNVEISEGVNELPEVVLLPYDLTGNMKVDAENIEVVNIPLPSMSGVLNDYNYEMRPDQRTGVTNAAMAGGEMEYGMKPIAIIKQLMTMILPRKKEKPKAPPKLNLMELENRLRTLYDNEFFLETLEVPTEQIHNFIAFIEAEGFPQKLLEKRNEMDLIQFLLEQSRVFHQDRVKE